MKEIAWPEGSSQDTKDSDALNRLRMSSCGISLGRSVYIVSIAGPPAECPGERQCADLVYG